MTWMLVRLVLSLAFVGLVLWFAARVAKKRGLGGGGNQGLIEVVARQRMGRSSTVNVVRIGDVVLVVGATEEQVTLLAEVDPETIDTPTGPREPARVAAPSRPAVRQAPEAPRPVPQGYAESGYDAARYEVRDHPAHDYADQGYPDRGYDGGYDGGYDEPSAGDGYAAAGHDQHGFAEAGYAEPRYSEPRYAERRPGGSHAEGPRHGSGTRRPAVAPAASDGPLAGSVFDKNGWGTFVNELRERTVRRP